MILLSTGSTELVFIRNNWKIAKLYLLELDRTVILSNVLLICGGYIDGLL